MRRNTKEYCANWYKKNAEHVRQYKKARYYKPDVIQLRKNADYLRKYGITLETYESMLTEQNYVCAICHCPEVELSTTGGGSIKSLAVDHCHATGAIRGLLCQRCNRILGLAQDNIIVLKQAAKYLA